MRRDHPDYSEKMCGWSHSHCDRLVDLFPDEEPYVVSPTGPVPSGKPDPDLQRLLTRLERASAEGTLRYNRFK